MNNEGVRCNVCECCHNVQSCKCELDTIEVTKGTAADNAVETPHFCKNYEEK